MTTDLEKNSLEIREARSDADYHIAYPIIRQLFPQLDMQTYARRVFVARATGYLRRDEVERALVTMSEAVRQLAEVRLVRSARAEVEIQIDEFLGMLVRRSDPSDARRSFIAMTPPSAKAMEGCLEAVLNQPGQ